MNMTTTRPNEQRLVVPLEKDNGLEIIRTLKLIALNNHMSSMKEVVLFSLAEKYPELKPLVDKELKG